MPANPFQDDSILSFGDLGTETRVNVETNSNQQNAALAILTNGNTVVTWESNLQDGSGLGVFARMFAPDGTALTGDLQMNVTTSGSQDGPDVVALDNDRAMVIWSSGGDIWYRLIEADGTSPAGEFQINSTSSASNYQINPFGSEDFMVTWESSDGVGTSSGVYGQRLAFNGTEVFNEIRINDAIAGAQRRADTAELTSGTVFTAFQSQGQVGTASDQGVYLRNYSNTSTLVGSDLVVADAVGEFEALPQIEALDGGGFVVTWVNTTTGALWAQTHLNTGAAVVSSLTNVSDAVGVNTLFAPVVQALPGDRYVVVWEYTSTLAKDLYYRVLQADGTTVTTGLLHTNTTGTQSQAQVHALPQGGFITVYTSGSGTALDLFIVRHAEDGTPAGPAMQVEYPVNTTTANTQSTPDVAVTDGGEIIVTWQSNNQDSSGLGIYVQRFESPQIGTPGSDNIDGDAEADFIAGWIGNDTIKGRGGDDRLDGGPGADFLTGGPGDDLLQGGSGGDQISGGNDDDTVDGGTDADLLFGNGGNDVMTGGTGEDSLRGGAGDDSILAGDDNDDVLGQSGADTIDGGSGNDTLLGGSGNDSLIGGDDDDDLFGQGNNDMLFGGQGNDTLTGAAGADTLEGGIGQDTLKGGNGADSLDGGAGDDLLNGGANADRLVFGVGGGNDTVSGFEDNIDTIEIAAALAGGMTVAQLLADTSITTQTGASVVMDFGGGDTLRINNVGVADLADDMVIV